MKPSAFSTSATRSRCLEDGIDTLDLVRICALRMRVIMSPIGSFTAIARLPSPARLHEARNEAFVAELTQRDTAELVLAVVGARTAGQFAAVADARARGIARQLRQLEGRGETFLDRSGLVLHDRLELLAPAGVQLRHPAPALVLLDRTLLRHLATLHLVPRLRPRQCASLPEREVECRQ